MILVASYSRTGNNQFLSRRLASDLGADLLELRPRVRAFPLMLLLALLGWSGGLRRFPVDLNAYEKIIVCGPLWMGRLCLPALDFLRTLRRSGRRAHLLVCCGSTDAAKNDAFGYERVFLELQTPFGGVVESATALPIDLVIPEAQKGDPQAVMAARLNDQSFSGPFAGRYRDFVAAVSTTHSDQRTS